MNIARQETFEDFRKSFNYGSRTDLLFKFLGSRDVSDREAAAFFQRLLELLGEAFDTGNYKAVMLHVYESQMRAYTPQGEAAAGPVFRYESTPWTPLRQPLSQSRLALISAGGIYAEGNDPMGPNGPTQLEAIRRIDEFLRMAPLLTPIPLDTEPAKLRVRHPGYDIRGAVRDPNVVFPIDRLKELQAEGVIGELAQESYSFVGATSQKRLLAQGAPAWSQLLISKQVDAVLLVAA